MIVDDGYRIEDVERSISVEAIQAYTGVEQTDMSTLWDLMIAKVEGRLIETKAEDISGEVSAPGEVVAPTKPKRKYTKKVK